MAFRILDHIVTYAATQGMSVASATRPSRRHHRCCRFLQRYDEMAKDAVSSCRGDTFCADEE